MAELSLHRVSYRYPRATRDVLQGVECSFRAGEVAAVVGPSGSGKTTLLSIMAGLDRPSGGEVLVDDKKLSEMNLDAYRRQYVSVIFQAFHLFPLLTVLENVCFPLELLGAGERTPGNRRGGTSSWWASARRSTAGTRASSQEGSSSAWR